MTKNETKAVRDWNIAQGKAANAADAKWRELHEKYLKLDGYAECSYHLFIHQIATCTKTTQRERDADLSALIQAFIDKGRYEALSDYLGAMANAGRRA